MNWYTVVLLVVGALIVLLLVPDETRWSVILAYVVVIGYLLAWFHRSGPMVASIVIGLMVVIYQDTVISVILQDTGAVGWDRVSEVMPAVITFVSLSMGYWCAWTRQVLHVVVCVFLVVASLVLGW